MELRRLGPHWQKGVLLPRNVLSHCTFAVFSGMMRLIAVWQVQGHGRRHDQQCWRGTAAGPASWPGMLLST
jgi:hypothetical protein